MATIRPTDPPIVITIRTGTNTIHAARPHMMTDAATVNTKPCQGASTPRRYANQSMTAAEPSRRVISQAGHSKEKMYPKPSSKTPTEQHGHYDMDRRQQEEENDKNFLDAFRQTHARLQLEEASVSAGA